MTDVTEAPVTSAPFLATLVRVIRAEDSYGSWDKKSDPQLLAEYVVTKEARRQIPIMGDPDPETLWRVDKYYAAIALRVEQLTGTMASPMMKMSHEGFGRVVLLAGRLVALSKHLRDVHRFGFDSLATLAEAGEAAAQDAAALVRQYPEVVEA